MQLLVRPTAFCVASIKGLSWCGIVAKALFFVVVVVEWFYLYIYIYKKIPPGFLEGFQPECNRSHTLL